MLETGGVSHLMQQVPKVTDERSPPRTVLDASIVHPCGHCSAGLNVKLWQAVESHSGGTHEYHCGSTSSCQPYTYGGAAPAPAWKRVEQNEGGVHTVVSAGVRVNGRRVPLRQVAVTAMSRVAIADRVLALPFTLQIKFDGARTLRLQIWRRKRKRGFSFLPARTHHLTGIPYSEMLLPNVCDWTPPSHRAFLEWHESAPMSHCFGLGVGRWEVWRCLTGGGTSVETF